MLFRATIYLPLTVASLTNLEFDASIGNYQIPCIRGHLVGEDLSNRCFHLAFSSDEIILRGARPNDYQRDIILEPVPGQEFEEYRLNRSQAALPENWREFTDYMGVGLGSDFGTASGSMILLPQNIDHFGTNFRMIISLTDPASFCFDRQLTLADAVPGTMSSVEINLSILEAEDTDQATSEPQISQTNIYQIETLEETQIPLFAWDRIAEVLRDGGIHQTSPRTLEAGCEHVIPLLPTLQFSIRSRGTYVGTIVMEGQDYVSVHPERRTCTLHVRGTTETYQLGLSVIERVGLYFDYRNNQIGFCEPA